MATPCQKALNNKALQEQTQSRLPPNTLYIALYIRSDPPTTNDFHWAFYLHTPSHHRGGGGTKHDTDNNSGGWMPHHDPTAGILKTNFLCMLVHIADIPGDKIELVEEIMRERDADINDIPGVTCRVWLFVILGRLVEEGLVRISGDGDRQAVEKDCLDWGNGFSADAARNVQPRPVVRSRVFNSSNLSAVGKKRVKLVDEYEKLRDHPGDELFTPSRAFETSVGHFWSMPGTRNYMRARFGFIDALGHIDTRDAVDTQFEHARDMLRLSRADSMGIRDIVPFAMLRTDRDQECYDVLKWYFTTGSRGDYDFGNMNIGFLDVKDADAFEPIMRLGPRDFSDLAHVTALALLKIKLLLDLQALGRTADVPRVRDMPPEIVDAVRSFVPRSPIIASNRAFLEQRNLETVILELEIQAYQAYSTVHTLNPHFWHILFNPQLHLTKRPPISTRGSLEEAQLVLVFSYRVWVETRGALELIKQKVDSKEWVKPPSDPRSSQTPFIHNTQSPYALVSGGWDQGVVG